MKLVDLTLKTPAENLACDEALLDESEEGREEELLRFWEAQDFFVVVGSSNRIAREVHKDSCHADNVPILRRHSGGGAVLQGPGCLNYCLILRMKEELSTISGTNAFILQRHKQAIEPLVGKPIEVRGFTDLAIKNMKFSGNSQRRRLRFLMFHGTVVLHLDLERVERYLKPPSKQPDYRGNRSHRDFIRNISLSSESVKGAIRDVWNAHDPRPAIPYHRIKKLVEQRYGADEWNLRM